MHWTNLLKTGEWGVGLPNPLTVTPWPIITLLDKASHPRSLVAFRYWKVLECMKPCEISYKIGNDCVSSLLPSAEVNRYHDALLPGIMMLSCLVECIRLGSCKNAWLFQRRCAPHQGGSSQSWDFSVLHLVFGSIQCIYHLSIVFFQQLRNYCVWKVELRWKNRRDHSAVQKEKYVSESSRWWNPCPTTNK